MFMRNYKSVIMMPLNTEYHTMSYNAVITTKIQYHPFAFL